MKVSLPEMNNGHFLWNLAPLSVTWWLQYDDSGARSPTKLFLLPGPTWLFKQQRLLTREHWATERELIQLGLRQLSMMNKQVARQDTNSWCLPEGITRSFNAPCCHLTVWKRFPIQQWCLLFTDAQQDWSNWKINLNSSASTLIVQWAQGQAANTKMPIIIY